MNGAYFVEALFRLGYPEAPTLKPKEFDWMFDDTPDTQEFLRFFCSLGSQNVLSKEEEHLYTALVESGKPILTELELEKLEQTLTSRGMVLNEEDEDDEQVEGDDVYESLGDLQQELENLRAQKRLRHQRLLQLQSLRQRHGSNARALSEHTQGQEQGDGEVEPVAVAKALAKENVTTNVLLQELQGEVKKLQGLVCEEGDPVERQQEYLQMERRSRSRRSAALLSQLPLEAYLQEVQLAHQSIMGHYKRCLAEDTSMLAEEEDEEEEEASEKEVGEGLVKKNRRELARLQAALLLIQAQLLQARAEEAGARGAKEWLSQQRSSDAQSVPPDSHSTPAVPSERLLALLHRRAEHQCLAALRADTRDQAESVQRYARLQERLCDALLNQHAQLELLRALLGAERGAHVRALAHTEQVAHSLKAEEATWASQRDEELARLQESLPKAQSEPSLSSKDPTISRLLAMLEAPEERDSCLDCVSELSGLISAQWARLEQLDGAEGRATAGLQTVLIGLEEEREALRQAALSNKAGQVQLSPQEVYEALQELEKQTASFFKQLQQVSADLSSKRSLLKHSAPLRRERELYVLFHLDPTQLGRVLEDWENS